MSWREQMHPMDGGFCNRCGEKTEGQERWCLICRKVRDRESVVCVRLSTDMKSWLLDECERMQATRSDYIRHLIASDWERKKMKRIEDERGTKKK